ncbi:MAG: hypothetical protein PHE15_05620 [Dehalococcoidales bacterium]|nr:hypothetical protein [Dehalococcoidales bacterium]
MDFEMYDLIHLGLGVASGAVDRLGPPVSAAFITYQVIENEQKTSTIQNLLEFGFGFLLGKLVKQR